MLEAVASGKRHLAPDPTRWCKPPHCLQSVVAIIGQWSYDRKAKESPHDFGILFVLISKATSSGCRTLCIAR